MFEIDLARGIAYKGRKGWIIKSSPQGLFIEIDNKMVFLTDSNSRIMEDMEIGYEPVNI